MAYSIRYSEDSELALESIAAYIAEDNPNIANTKTSFHSV